MPADQIVVLTWLRPCKSIASALASHSIQLFHTPDTMQTTMSFTAAPAAQVAPAAARCTTARRAVRAAAPHSRTQRVTVAQATNGEARTLDGWPAGASRAAVWRRPRRGAAASRPPALYPLTTSPRTRPAAVASASSSPVATAASASAPAPTSGFVPVLRPEDLPKGVRKEVRANGKTVLLFWYRNQIYAIEARSPAEGAYSEGFIRAKFTQDFCIGAVRCGWVWVPCVDGWVWVRGWVGFGCVHGGGVAYGWAGRAAPILSTPLAPPKLLLLSAPPFLCTHAPRLPARRAAQSAQPPPACSASRTAAL